MSKPIRNHTNIRQVTRFNKKTRIRKKITQNKSRTARLVIYRSNRFLYAQIVDDLKGHTLVQANTGEENLSFKSPKNTEAAKALGTLIGKRAVEKQINKVLFDRNGFNYHGRIKALAESAREAGLKF